MHACLACAVTHYITAVCRFELPFLLVSPLQLGFLLGLGNKQGHCNGCDNDNHDPAGSAAACIMAKSIHDL